MQSIINKQKGKKHSRVQIKEQQFLLFNVSSALRKYKETKQDNTRQRFLFSNVFSILLLLFNSQQDSKIFVGVSEY